MSGGAEQFKLLGSIPVFKSGTLNIYSQAFFDKLVKKDVRGLENAALRFLKSPSPDAFSDRHEAICVSLFAGEQFLKKARVNMGFRLIMLALQWMEPVSHLYADGLKSIPKQLPSIGKLLSAKQAQELHQQLQLVLNRPAESNRTPHVPTEDDQLLSGKTADLESVDGWEDVLKEIKDEE